MTLKIKSLILIFLVLSYGVFAQEKAKAPENWFNLDEKEDGVRGVSTEKAYKTLLKKKKAKKTVVVAVIDSGIDIEHEDLEGKIWINTKEKNGKDGKDDDGNGYVDDIYGWNFIGGKDGKHVNHDSYELTRLYAKLSKKYEGKSESDAKDKEEYKYYQTIKKKYESKVKEMKSEFAQFNMFYSMAKPAFEKVKKHLKKDKITEEDLKDVDMNDAELKEAVGMVKTVFGYGVNEDYLEEGKNYFDSGLKYGYNTEFDPRDIVGDNYENKKEKVYGNNSVEGPDADHGTHVAGIIGANRNNKLGMAGVANDVKIMVLRTVPNGDERDKDVANAIRYAVDNGAEIVNMSFGKDFSPEKDIVDAAVKYAEKKGVLLIHASGNDGENIDKTDNFPTDICTDGKTASNWIEVGASSWKNEGEFVATFSNYGKEQVDIFAPGVAIYSTIPDSKYTNHDGTSMAAPVVTGVAALVKSYYPNLTAVQLKEVLLKSSIKYTGKEVNKPGSKSNIKFEELSQTGGIVNAYEALKLAEEMSKGKK